MVKFSTTRLFRTVTVNIIVWLLDHRSRSGVGFVAKGTVPMLCAEGRVYSLSNTVSRKPMSPPTDWSQVSLHHAIGITSGRAAER